MFEEIKDGKRRVSTPCPDGIPGCLVAHFKWVPIEEVKPETDEKQMHRIKERWVSHGILYQDDGDWIIEQAEKRLDCEDAFDKLLQETAKVDEQYVILHRESREQAKQLQKLEEEVEVKNKAFLITVEEVTEYAIENERLRESIQALKNSLYNDYDGELSRETRFSLGEDIDNILEVE